MPYVDRILIVLPIISDRTNLVSCRVVWSPTCASSVGILPRRQWREFKTPDTLNEELKTESSKYLFGILCYCRSHNTLWAPSQF